MQPPSMEERERENGQLLRALEAASSLIDSADVWSDHAARVFEDVFDALSTLLHADGAVELEIDEAGALYVNGSLLARRSESRQSLGPVFAGVGIREIVFMPGLEPLHLTKFLQIVALVGDQPSGPESDLVTYWTEEGEDTIEIARTSLGAAYLLPENPEPLSEPTILQAMLSSTSRRSAVIDNWVEILGELLDGDPESLDARVQPLRAADHRQIQSLFATLSEEDETSLRRQFMATLMAAMSARTPALSMHEYGFLAARVLGEQMLEGAWDDIMRAIRNLEYLVNSGAHVARHTRDAATMCLQKLHSAAVLERLIAASNNTFPPYRLVRWFVGEEPLEAWKQVAPRVDIEDTEALVNVFSTCFAFQHPFWNQAIDVLSAPRARAAREVLSRLETTFSDNGFEAVSTGSAPDQSTLSWDDFDLDTLDDNEQNELDASLIAFLDASDSQLGEADESDDLAADMLDQLDELEQSIARGVSPGDAEAN